MSILDSIVHFVKGAAVKVSGLFEQIFGRDVAHNFAVGAEGVLKTDLGKIAWAVVNEVQAVAAGTDKQAVAFEKIAAAAASAGIEAKGSIVNMLIELAVQKLKGSFGPA